MSDVIEYKCPSCNASMVFDSKSQHMKCPYCDTEMTVEEFQRTQKSEDTQTTGKSISNDNWYSSFTFVRTLIKCIISSFYMCFVIDYPHNPLRP